MEVKTQTKAASPVPASKVDWHLTSHWSKTACLVRTVPCAGELPRERCFWSENLHTTSIRSVPLLIMHSLRHCKSRGGRDTLSNRSHVTGTPYTGGIHCNPYGVLHAWMKGSETQWDRPPFGEITTCLLGRGEKQECRQTFLYPGTIYWAPILDYTGCCKPDRLPDFMGLTGD